ncbi:MAG: adenosylmethionine decarboxylase [Candidatus Diapherotrites archaeon CG11_big_fil_rev_8_21_14_0_20_37_9]|nr:MAG: adenosylmethionine decarboxylase [Candidatus Diapherotrites archaeon CG11_big_fil_rev_8_21_14_0_20_37_9]
MDRNTKIVLEGTHLMLDTFGCSKKALGNQELIKEFLSRLPEELGMKKLIQPYLVAYPGGDSWDRGGITAIMLIAESHISIHTFPEDGFFTADVYSCKPFDVEKALKLFREYFKGKDEKIQVAKRELEFVRTQNLAMLMNKAK